MAAKKKTNEDNGRMEEDLVPKTKIKGNPKFKGIGYGMEKLGTTKVKYKKMLHKAGDSTWLKKPPKRSGKRAGL